MKTLICATGLGVETDTKSVDLKAFMRRFRSGEIKIGHASQESLILTLIEILIEKDVLDAGDINALLLGYGQASNLRVVDSFAECEEVK